MEEDLEVGDSPLAELVGLHFGLPSNEDTLAMSMFEKNQNIIEPKIFYDSCLGVYFLTGDGSRCSSYDAFTKDTCDAASSSLHSPGSPNEAGYMPRPTSPQAGPMDGCCPCPQSTLRLGRPGWM